MTTVSAFPESVFLCCTLSFIASALSASFPKSPLNRIYSENCPFYHPSRIPIRLLVAVTAVYAGHSFHERRLELTRPDSELFFTPSVFLLPIPFPFPTLFSPTENRCRRRPACLLYVLRSPPPEFSMLSRELDFLLVPLSAFTGTRLLPLFFRSTNSSQNR